MRRALVLRTLQRASLVAARAIGDRMNAEVRIERLAAEETLDPVTGVLSFAKTVQVYTGRAHVGPRSGSGQVDWGGETLPLAGVRVSLPLSATEPRDGDQLTVLSHPDAVWVGAVFSLDTVEAPGAVPGMRVLHGTGVLPDRRRG